MVNKSFKSLCEDIDRIESNIPHEEPYDLISSQWITLLWLGLILAVILYLLK